MEARLEGILDKVITEAKRVFMSHMMNGETLEPVMIICRAEGMGVVQVGPLMNVPELKDALGNVMRKHIQEPDIDLMVLVSEAWTVITNKDVDVSKLMDKWGGRFSEHPDRKECLMLSAIGKVDNVFVQFPIDRDKKELGEPQRIDGNDVQGRFTNNPDRDINETLH